MDDQENTFQNLFHKQQRGDSHGIVICGHRGGCGTSEPENTLRAFQSAIDKGIQCFEFDVSYVLFFTIYKSKNSAPLTINFISDMAYLR